MSRMIEIDGCNVAECKYINGLHKGVYGCINLNLNPACYKNPNCYFKQLQRVKSENEELKKLNANHLKIINDFLHENNILKEENGKLKRSINIHLTTFDKCCVDGLIMSNNISEVLNE